MLFNILNSSVRKTWWAGHGIDHCVAQIRFIDIYYTCGSAACKVRRGKGMKKNGHYNNNNSVYSAEPCAAYDVVCRPCRKCEMSLSRTMSTDENDYM